MPPVGFVGLPASPPWEERRLQIGMNMSCSTWRSLPSTQSRACCLAGLLAYQKRSLRLHRLCISQEMPPSERWLQRSVEDDLQPLANRSLGSPQAFCVSRVCPSAYRGSFSYFPCCLSKRGACACATCEVSLGPCLCRSLLPHAWERRLRTGLDYLQQLATTAKY